MFKIIKYHSFFVVMLCIMGCTLAEVNVEVVSERTALENQILGTYNALDKEMLLVASVRGVDPNGTIATPPKHSRGHNEAMMAMQVQAFHADDIQAFKALGWVGENNQGELTVFPMQRQTVPENLEAFAKRFQPDEFNAVIEQVNKARRVIMQRVIDMNEHLNKEDLPKIRQIFGKLNVENAKPGEKIQSKDGSWTVKQADQGIAGR